MFHGFYNLASGVLYQNRNLDVISNNMVNVGTPGYKADRMLSTTFREEMLVRSGNRDKSDQTQIGSVTMIRAARGTETRYEQGALEETGENLDFALTKPGFFAVETADGNQVYTRNGSFVLDGEGYLTLSGVGRVMGDGGPIQLPTDHFEVDRLGNIYEKKLTGLGGDEEDTETDEEANLLGKIMVVDFDDYAQLTKGDNGVFTTEAQGNPVDGGILWKTIERSNMDPIDEMTAMMSSQRASQSAAQMLKMYDQLMGRIVSEIGKI